MLPNQATFIRDAKDTADIISQEKPLAIGDKIWMTDPNMNRALGWAFNNGFTESTNRRQFGHLEDTPFPNFVIANDDESSQDATGLVFESGAGERLTVGSRICVARTEEIIRIDAAFANTTTSAGVTRNWGRGSASNYLKKGDVCVILPPNFPEGFTTGEALSNAMYYKGFNCSEISYPVEVTTVENAERSRGGNPFKRALKKTIKQVKDQKEIEFLKGAQKTDNSFSPHPIGAADGIDNYITTNSWSASKISRMDFFDILVQMKQFNPDTGAILCSLAFKSLVTQWAMDMTTYTIPVKSSKTGGSLGLSIDKVTWTAGTWDLIDVDILGQVPDWMGDVYFVPKGKIRYAPLVGYEDLTPGYRPLNPGGKHVKWGEVYGVYGWEYYEEQTWGKLKGMQFAA